MLDIAQRLPPAVAAIEGANRAGDRLLQGSNDAMAGSLHDIISVGVPHRVARTTVSDEEFAKLGFVDGSNAKFARHHAIDLQRRFALNSAPEPGPVLRLAATIAASGSRVAVMKTSRSPALVDISGRAADTDYCGVNGFGGWRYTDHACRIDFETPRRAKATAIHYSLADQRDLRQSALLVRSGRVLCLEDRLWDAEGGAEFAARSLEIARAAGRTTMLVCKDADCIFRNSPEIRKVADKDIDYFVGDAAVLLLLHNVQRFDSLVPRLRAMAAKAILWRRSHNPLVVERDVATWASSVGQLDADSFWGAFLPACIAKVARSGYLNEFEALARPPTIIAANAASGSGGGSAPGV